MTAKKKTDDTDLEACLTDLETLRGQLEAQVAAQESPEGVGAAVSGISLLEILAVVKAAADLIQRWRNR